MWRRVLTGLWLGAALLGIASAPALASSHTVRFTLGPCTQTSKVTVFNITGLNPNDTIFFSGGSLSLLPSAGTVKYLTFGVAQGPNKVLLLMGVGETSARYDLTTYYLANSDASGNVPLFVQGSCSGGGSVSGLATIFDE